MNTFKIPHDYPRQYVPQDASLGFWNEVDPLFIELETRALVSMEDLKRWLYDIGEIMEVLDEQYTERYVNMTCATDDEALSQEYLRYLSEVSEPSKPRFFNLMKRYLDCPHRSSLPHKEMEVFDRSAENQVLLFRQENVALETQEQGLSQDYQKLSGSLTVHHQGQEQTLQQMARSLELADRTQREEAWRLISSRRLREKDRFDHLFDEMRALRTKMALNAGFDNYRDFAFKKRERFDYGVAECEAFHEGVEKAVVPVLRSLQDRRARRMGLETLKPWDLQNDPLGRAPLKPFVDVEELSSKCRSILQRLDPVFGDQYTQMKDLGLLDLDSRKGKAPGGYNVTLSETRLPFIFMNAVGLDSDVRTLLHESGHALHAFASREIPFPFYRTVPLEFCEVASMGMELLAAPYLSEFYPDPVQQARSSLKHFEDILTLLPWIAQIDAFQHWVYTHPNHSREERCIAWVSLCKRFGGLVDWSGLEDVQAHLWHRQLHLFESPFYYIEYGIAQLGALQVWVNVRKDPKAGLAAYKNGLAVGGSLTLPEIFRSTGIRFDFSTGMIKPLMEEVMSEIRRLENK